MFFKQSPRRNLRIKMMWKDICFKKRAAGANRAGCFSALRWALFMIRRNIMMNQLCLLGFGNQQLHTGG